MSTVHTAHALFSKEVMHAGAVPGVRGGGRHLHDVALAGCAGGELREVHAGAGELLGALPPKLCGRGVLPAARRRMRLRRGQGGQRGLAVGHGGGVGGHQPKGHPLHRALRLGICLERPAARPPCLLVLVIVVVRVLQMVQSGTCQRVAQIHVTMC